MIKFLYILMENRNRKLKHWIKIDLLLVAYDLLFTYLSYMLALLLRFDGRFSAIPERYRNAAAGSLLIVSVVSVVIAYLCRMYHSIWRFSSIDELLKGTVFTLLCTVFNVILTVSFFIRMPLSYYVIGALFQFFFCCGIRFSYRLFLYLKKRVDRDKDIINTMVTGAGEAGTMLIRDINNNAENTERVVCIIDDNPNKWNRIIHNVPVVGGRDTIESNVVKYNIDRIVLAIPSATGQERKELLEIASRTRCDIKTIPSLYRLTNEISRKSLEDIQIQDLLGRDEIQTDLEEVFSFIRNKTVLVTGAGGSIGSELSRQIAANDPKELILFDIYENSTYSLELELKDRYPDLQLYTRIGSVRDHRKIMGLFNKFRPDIVYHAAAHKHVPLMEDSPNEAIKNNSFGTFNVASAALANNVSRLVFISTDKAVNPINIMGASKRICEMIVQMMNRCIIEDKTDRICGLYEDLYGDRLKLPKRLNTVFSAVRFGNVLGSNGSVVPLFKKQIDKGGPVTVTDPNIVRYFMTIPEAVSLVLQSSVYAKGGEIFVLDMGEPVKIVDLAKKMIALAGKTEEEIKIKYIGLRPGEKLYEERLMDEEGMSSTANRSISIGRPLEFRTASFISALKRIYRKAENNDPSIEEEVAKLVTTYRHQ
ncbi:MAG: polysaccharide biosynthesis protein [Erysipelotrichaceae bacterium]|nr:polysaccharide biosynthesis protein [Erysipelotrichaceae bacterium]